MGKEKNAQPVDYDLTCWYINQRRILELLDTAVVLPLLVQTARLPGNQLQSNAQLKVTTARFPKCSFPEEKISRRSMNGISAA